MGTALFNIKANSDGVYDTQGNVLAGSPNLPICDIKSPLSTDSNKRCFRVDATHRINMTMKTPVSVKGCDWTLAFWFMSTNNGSGNRGDWSLILSNFTDFDFRIDTDHNYDGAMACIPNIGYYTRAWKSKVCDQKWHQIMACHLASNNTIYGFMDGNLENQVVADFNITGTTFAVGGANFERNYYVDGFMDDVYLIKDACLHTESFTLDTLYATDLLNTRKTWYDVPSKKLYGFK